MLHIFPAGRRRVAESLLYTPPAYKREDSDHHASQGCFARSTISTIVGGNTDFASAGNTSPNLQALEPVPLTATPRHPQNPGQQGVRGLHQATLAAPP